MNIINRGQSPNYYYEREKNLQGQVNPQGTLLPQPVSFGGYQQSYTGGQSNPYSNGGYGQWFQQQNQNGYYQQQAYYGNRPRNGYGAPIYGNTAYYGGGQYYNPYQAQQQRAEYLKQLKEEERNQSDIMASLYRMTCNFEGAPVDTNIMEGFYREESDPIDGRDMLLNLSYLTEEEKADYYERSKFEARIKKGQESIAKTKQYINPNEQVVSPQYVRFVQVNNKMKEIAKEDMDAVEYFTKGVPDFHEYLQDQYVKNYKNNLNTKYDSGSYTDLIKKNYHEFHGSLRGTSQALYDQEVKLPDYLKVSQAELERKRMSFLNSIRRQDPNVVFPWEVGAKREVIVDTKGTIIDG